MAKKKKQNLQKLIAKKQQLQQVAQGGVISFDQTAEAIEPYHQPEMAVIPAGSVQPRTTGDRRLRQTAISIVMIAILLGATVIFDRKSPYLDQFGNWVYTALQLQN